MDDDVNYLTGLPDTWLMKEDEFIVPRNGLMMDIIHMVAGFVVMNCKHFSSASVPRKKPWVQNFFFRGTDAEEKKCL